MTRQAETETESLRPSLMASALDLYLRLSGQIPTSETDEVLKPEPLVIPIPDLPDWMKSCPAF